MAGEIMLRCAAVCDAGLGRQRNEDSAYAGRWLYAVADGLGGHVAGDLASATVVTALRACDAKVTAARLLATLSEAVRAANEILARKVAADPALAGMGTTLTAMLWSDRSAAIAHIGDSRAYLLRGGRLLRITEDHRLDGLVDDSGRPSPGLVRYLGGKPEESPDMALYKGLPGDRYLLCSDGLSSVVSQTAILQALQSAASADEAVHSLIALAYDAGAPDNITVLVLDVAEARAGAGVLSEPVMLGAATALARCCRSR
jgi:PPM family protein phosphatase